MAFDFSDLPLSDFLWRKLQDGLELRPALASLDDDASEALNTRSKVPHAALLGVCMENCLLGLAVRELP